MPKADKKTTPPARQFPVAIAALKAGVRRACRRAAAGHPLREPKPVVIGGSTLSGSRGDVAKAIIDRAAREARRSGYSDNLRRRMRLLDDLLGDEPINLGPA